MNLQGSDAVRFLGLVETTRDGCWIWRGNRTVDGYGQFQTPAGTRRAHRVAFELFVREIADGESICHRCDKPACVNPEHLFAGSPLDNIRDAMAKSRMAYGSRNGWTTQPDAMLRKRPRRMTSRQTVAAIRAASEAGVSRADLARRFDLHISAVSRIANGQRRRFAKEASA